MAVPPFRCELEARWQATAGQDLSVGTSVRKGIANQPLADNWLTIGSGSRFPAVAPNREIPKKNEGQRSPAAPSCVGSFALGAGGRRFESGRPDQNSSNDSYESRFPPDVDPAPTNNLRTSLPRFSSSLDVSLAGTIKTSRAARSRFTHESRTIEFDGAERSDLRSIPGSRDTRARLRPHRWPQRSRQRQTPSGPPTEGKIQARCLEADWRT